eukprot:scaffold622890_cov22-Prasinocladus_malaysianus.AAC.1
MQYYADRSSGRSDHRVSTLYSYSYYGGGQRAHGYEYMQSSPDDERKRDRPERKGLRTIRVPVRTSTAGGDRLYDEASPT